MNIDWNEIAERKPQGYIELNDGKFAVHGPIESVIVTEDDMVQIRVKWLAKITLGGHGIPTGNWKAIENTPTVLTEFPNLVAPFVIENTPEKGPRARFGANILYFNRVEGIDPSKVEGLRISTT